MTDTAAFVVALQALADPLRAAAMAAYMRGRFSFLGIQTTGRRRATRAPMRAAAGDALAVAEALWQLPQREYQYVACDLLRQQAKHLPPDALPRLLALVRQHSWWDTVDSLAVSVGEMVLRHRELVVVMDRLIADDDFWLRRVALLHQLSWKMQTDEERLFAYCRRCAPEREFFIRKAIGWALRQYARVQPERVRAFLDAERENLSPLSLREAGKHLG